jgi:death-on-curing protein
MASAYLFHLCQKHAFTDGDKRVALMTASIFLTSNRYQIKSSADELERLVLAVASVNCSKNELASWMKKHIEPLH